MDFHFSQFEIATATGALFLCLLLLVVSSEAGDIEADLTIKSAQALAGSELYWHSAQASGQKVRVAGAAHDRAQAQAALDSVADIWGVTRVIDELSIVGDAGVCQQRFRALLDDDPIRFKKGRAEVSNASAAVIDALAKTVVDCNVVVEVAAHTDGSGDADINLGLSERRAEAVRKLMLRKGAPQTHVTSAGYGEAQPIAENLSTHGRDRNRRIEVRILGAAA